MLDDYQGVALQMADWAPVLQRCQVDVFREPIADQDALADRLAGYDVVVLMRERTPLPAAVIDHLPDLRLVVTTGRRNAAVDVAAARARGIVVCGTESRASGPSELTWALILGLSRQLVVEHHNVCTGGWQTTVGKDLAGATLGVLGLGRIGSQVASVGRAFGMQVLAWSPHLTTDRAAANGATAAPLDTVLAAADVVTLHLVLSASTRGVLAARELALMKPGALLINTSRGPLVDEPAMRDALARGHLGGVGLDVYDREPLPPTHPLRRAPRTLLTPHVGYVTESGYRTFFSGVVADILAFLDGEPIRVLD